METKIKRKLENVNDKDWTLYCKFKMLLEEKYVEYSYADSYYIILGVPLKKLNEIVKSFTGKTACQLADEKIVLEAKRILTHQHIKIKEVAWQLGYEDEYYFSRIFKKIEGIAPKNYKKKFLLEE